MSDTEYRLESKEGDIVRMPGGTLAIVKGWDIIEGGNVKRVDLFPFTNWLHRLWLLATDKLTVYDGDINKLTLVHAS